MYDAGPIGGGQLPYSLALADVAQHGRLVIYTGAGLSRDDPTGIPPGAEVARRCHGRLADLLGDGALEDANPSNLTSVADAVAALDGGLDLLRRTAVGVAEFTTADSNFGHEVLALLLLEGLVVAITTNWDDCIERAGGTERVLAVISDQDRQEIHATALLKVHGCATRPDTILVTSEDLDCPPMWVRDEVNARLADSHVVFVGIGDVAGYVRSRIEEAAQAVGAGGAVYVVSPGITDGWEETQWADVLPDLPVEHRVGVSADEFLDSLAASCIRLVLREIAEAIDDQPETHEAFELVRNAFNECTSVCVLQWLRACAVPRVAGSSVLRQQAFASVLIAMGKLGQDGVQLLPRAQAQVNGSIYEVLIGLGTVSASRFRREAEARLGPC